MASTLYPVLRVMMLPLSAVLLDAVGAAWLLVGQGVLSLMAAAVESGIRIHEERRPPEESSSLRAWWADVKEAARYLRQEKGLMNIYGYMAVTNGVGSGYSPILVAFFRTFPGMTAAMYSLFSVAEFLGRTVGGFVQYRMEIPERSGTASLSWCTWCTRPWTCCCFGCRIPDAGQPGPVWIFGDQQRHHAPGGGAAVYSGKAPGPGQRL